MSNKDGPKTNLLVLFSDIQQLDSIYVECGSDHHLPDNTSLLTNCSLVEPELVLEDGCVNMGIFKYEYSVKEVKYSFMSRFSVTF